MKQILLRNHGRIGPRSLLAPLVSLVIALSMLASCSNRSPCVQTSPQASVAEQIALKAICLVTRSGLLTDSGTFSWPKKIRENFRHYRLTGKIETELEGGVDKTYRWHAEIYWPEGYNWNGRILWYMHGACAKGDYTNDLYAAENYLIYNELTRGKPIIITLGLGNFWLLDEDLLPKYQDVMAEVLETMIPDAAQRGGCKHWLMGLSMGGLNALQLVLFDEGRFNYERVAIFAPYLPRCDPFDSSHCAECLRDKVADGRNEYITYHAAALRGIRTAFSEVEWEFRNPVEAAKAGKFETWRDRMMLVWGPRDEFGFDVKSKELVEATGLSNYIEDPYLKHQMPGDPRHWGIVARFLEQR